MGRTSRGSSWNTDTFVMRSCLRMDDYVRESQTLVKRIGSSLTKDVISIFMDVMDASSRNLNGYSPGSRRRRQAPARTRAADGLEGLRLVISQAKNSGFATLPQAMVRIYMKIDEVKSTEPKRSVTYKYVCDLEKFLTLLGSNPVIQDFLGVCCLQRAVSKPKAIACHNLGCTKLISDDEPSWYLHNQANDRIRVCYTCIAPNDEPSIKIRMNTRLDDASPFDTMVSLMKKADFRKSKMSLEGFKEPQIECAFCRKVDHPVCVLQDEFNWESIYSHYCEDFSKNFRPIYCCQPCMKEFQRKNGKQEAPVDTVMFTPDRIRKTRLSRQIERDVANLLRDLTGQSNIIVREVSSYPKTFEALPGMKKEFQKNGRPWKFTYIRRTFMVFQKAGNAKVHIPIFCLIVGEYENKWVTIMYIDSLRFFEPADRPDIRRLIFQEVIVSYMQTAEERGYENVQLWVCPSIKEDEYVFLGRGYLPEQNKNDTSKPPLALMNWYKTALNKSMDKRIVSEYRQVGKSYNPWPNYLDVPYFEGDFIPERMEALLTSHSENSKKVNRKTSSRSQKLASQKSINDMWKDVVDTECREQIFVISLNPRGNANPARVGRERDMLNPYLSNRDNFIYDCRENGYDFADKRRAEYTSVKLCSRSAKLSTFNCLTCEKRITHGVYCCESDCLGARTVFCSYACSSYHFHDEGHGPYIREFVTPYDKIKFEPNPVFQLILQHMNDEAKFCSRIAFFQAVSCAPHRLDKLTCEQARALVRHQTWLAVPNNVHATHQRFCVPCKAMLTMLRHKDFCLGKVCRVPGCAQRSPFNIAGVLC